MLHEKLEKWRESFNLSKMFQDAVSEAIQKKEEFQKRIREDLDLGQVVERLRREKMQSEGNYFESGKKDGIQWAKTAHYDHLQYALQWNDLENATKDHILGDYFCRINISNRVLDSDTYCNSEYFLNYLQGWKQGIEQLWEEVREKL
jgi:histidinol-phosphate/aromatic aminotransferase/cobyric acid decarboxylase-like protein